MADRYQRERSYDNGLGRYIKYLPIIIALIAIVVAFTNVEFQTSASAGDIEENKAAIEANAEKITDVRERVIVIGNEQNHMRDDIREMGEDIKTILRAVAGKLHADKDFDE